MERYSPGDTGRSMALYNLADSLDDRLMEIDDIANLDQAITLHRSALDLHPAARLDRHLQEGGTLVELPWTFVTRPSYRSVILHDLAIYLNDGYDKQGNIPGLEDAIALGRAALAFRPPGTLVVPLLLIIL